MICKDSFVKIMDSLRDYWDELDGDMDRLNVVFEDNYLTRVFDRTMDALCDDLEPGWRDDGRGDPWIYYFAFELDWGHSEKAKDRVRINDTVYPMYNAGQLYDLLMALNERDQEEVNGDSN